MHLAHGLVVSCFTLFCLYIICMLVKDVQNIRLCRYVLPSFHVAEFHGENLRKFQE